MRTFIRVGPLKPVFERNGQKFSTQLARLCVLYWDLDIEMQNMTADSIASDTDRVGKEIRIIYYLRRGTATLTEMAQVFRVMSSTPEIKKWMATLGRCERKAWEDGLAWCHSDAFHHHVERFRNALGGHVHDDAARHALAMLEDEDIGISHVYPRGNGYDVRSKVAEQIVAAALSTHKGDEDKVQYVHSLFPILIEGQKHVRDMAQLILYDFVHTRLRS